MLRDVLQHMTVPALAFNIICRLIFTGCTVVAVSVQLTHSRKDFLMKLIQKALQIAFIVTAVLTMLEYYFVSGMFTSLIMMLLILAIGVINCIFSTIEKHFNTAILYALCTFSLCLAYLKIML